MAGFMDKIKKFVGSDDLEDEYDDYEEEAVVEKQPGSRVPTRCEASRKGGVVIVKQQGSRVPCCFTI